MSRYYILSNNHETIPCNIHTWAAWFETTLDRHVKDQTIGEVRLSTVFLGLDHNYSRYGEPLLFETMVFGGEYNGLMCRYHTWEEALKGHNKIYRKLFIPKKFFTRKKQLEKARRLKGHR